MKACYFADAIAFESGAIRTRFGSCAAPDASTGRDGLFRS